MHAFVNALSNVMPCFCRRVRPGMLRSVQPRGKCWTARCWSVRKTSTFMPAIPPPAATAGRRGCVLVAASAAALSAEQQSRRRDGGGLQQLAACDPTVLFVLVVLGARPVVVLGSVHGDSFRSSPRTGCGVVACSKAATPLRASGGRMDGCAGGGGERTRLGPPRGAAATRLRAGGGRSPLTGVGPRAATMLAGLLRGA